MNLQFEKGRTHETPHLKSALNGKDKWKVDKATVTLYFDNGQSISQEVGYFELESKDSKLVETGYFDGK